jgi:hypothetical protein
MLVEKFIAKCPAEYKVPGLYIVDSIVRQSKHNHKEKDVFGPRFARNLPTTFTHIFKCKSEDISVSATDLPSVSATDLPSVSATDLPLCLLLISPLCLPLISLCVCY